jgi:proline dehydrogenase
MPILNQLITTILPFIPKTIVGQVAKKYIAGVHLYDGVRVAKNLNGNGMKATMDLLGEDVKSADEAELIKNGIISIIQSIKENKLDSNVSVKPTQIGLKIDKELGYRNLKTIIEEAYRLGSFVRIDMEDASTTDDTLAMYRRLYSDGFKNIGVVIQSYMHRSEADVRALVKDRTNIRLCKGIYNELPSIAYKKKQEIRDNFLMLLKIIIENGCYVGIATHDDYLIDNAYEMVQKYGLGKDQYEFQMLLGVREKRRNSIVSDGHNLRIYIPFGEQWYAYSMRRLKENPHMAWYITKAFFVH